MMTTTSTIVAGTSAVSGTDAMNDREKRRLAVTASVIVVSGFTLAGSQLIVADVDRSRHAAEREPASGLVRAPAPPRRRVVVVRRTRAS